MIRLLVLLLAVVLCGCQSQPGSRPTLSAGGEEPQSPVILQSVEYEVRETLTLVNRGAGRPSKQNLWVALIRDLPPYQTVQSMQVAPGDYQSITDECGNEYAEFDLANMAPGETIQIQIEYQVVVHELIYELANCSGGVPDEFTQAELHVESENAQIVELSQELSEGQDTACELQLQFALGEDLGVLAIEVFPRRRRIAACGDE